MTPLVNVLFGAIFLDERLTRMQVVSVGLAGLGVLNLTFGYGHLPWVALLLCVSFGIYGLLRKQSGTRPIPGLFFETVLLAPIALVYLGLLKMHGHLAFARDGWFLSILLLTTGVVTAVPLVWFGHAARHLRLTTLGFLQYLSPTCSFLLGVFVYHEPFSRAHLITFCLIWLALVVFTAEAIMRLRNERRRAVLEEAVVRAPV
jgi:chloramphenicol-sensitive protein RarD